MSSTFENLRRRALVAVAALYLALNGCEVRGPRTHVDAPEAAVGSAALRAQQALFAKGVERVTDGVYVAIGYGIANSILIEGEDGVIIVDALEGRPQAEEVKDAFEQVTRKPVKALILTHNHADHVFGAAVFTSGSEPVSVFAHETTLEQIERTLGVVGGATHQRGVRMFGQALPEGQHITCGIGPALYYKPENTAFTAPTKTFKDRLDVVISGVRVVMLHAPGETPDQIVVWLPDKKLLIPADNIYQAFPNLYTIRGTPYRDLMQWVASLDTMRSLGAEFLVPCHTRFLSGKDVVEQTLTAYRDAIQFVHDQTIRQINNGLTPDEIAASLRLPDSLSGHPWLQERYGTVEWSVRAIYAGYLGWFDGDTTRLRPLPSGERARRYADAFAAGRPLSEQCRTALDAGDLRWGAELGSLWLQAEPGSQEARDTLAALLEQLGLAETNPNARNYYLTQAGEFRGTIHLPPPDPTVLPDEFIESLPIALFMRTLPTRLDAEKARGINASLALRFTDIDVTYLIRVRNSVAEVTAQQNAKADFQIEVTSRTWKRIATGKYNAGVAFAAGDLEVEGNLMRTLFFLRMFIGR